MSLKGSLTFILHIVLSGVGSKAEGQVARDGGQLGSAMATCSAIVLMNTPTKVAFMTCWDPFVTYPLKIHAFSRACVCAVP